MKEANIIGPAFRPTNGSASDFFSILCLVGVSEKTQKITTPTFQLIDYDSNSHEKCDHIVSFRISELSQLGPCTVFTPIILLLSTRMI
jgi:hypothetical protein